eukprot:scaffold2822_cov192-Ochromonas_danica.AAC.4
MKTANCKYRGDDDMLTTKVHGISNVPRYVSDGDFILLAHRQNDRLCAVIITQHPHLSAKITCKVTNCLVPGMAENIPLAQPDRASR